MQLSKFHFVFSFICLTNDEVSCILNTTDTSFLHPCQDVGLEHQPGSERQTEVRAVNPVRKRAGGNYRARQEGISGEQSI